MKEFNLEEAKAGKLVCVDNGEKARIICFDAHSEYPIIALITCKYSQKEFPYAFNNNGISKYIKGVTNYRLVMVE